MTKNSGTVGVSYFCISKCSHIGYAEVQSWIKEHLSNKWIQKYFCFSWHRLFWPTWVTSSHLKIRQPDRRFPVLSAIHPHLGIIINRSPILSYGKNLMAQRLDTWTGWQRAGLPCWTISSFLTMKKINQRQAIQPCSFITSLLIFFHI